MHINQITKSRISYQFIIIFVMIFNVTTIFASAILQTATTAAPVHATAALAPLASKMTIQTHRVNTDKLALTIAITPDQPNTADTLASILIRCHRCLKASAEQELDVTKTTHLFFDAQQAYEQLRLINSKKADLLWQNCKQYNSKFFTHIKNSFEQYIKQMHDCVNDLNFMPQKKVDDSVKHFVFNRPVNPWHTFLEASDNLHMLFSGKTYEYFTDPIWQDYVPEYTKSLGYVQTMRKSQEVFAQLKTLIDSIGQSIEKRKKYAFISCYRTLSEQYDLLNVLLHAQLPSHEKKRAEYTQLLQKTGQDSAAAKK